MTSEVQLPPPSLTSVSELNDYHSEYDITLHLQCY